MVYLPEYPLMVFLQGYPPWFTYQDIHPWWIFCQDIHNSLPARISAMVYLPGYPFHSLPTKISAHGLPTRISIHCLTTKISTMVCLLGYPSMVYLPGYPPMVDILLGYPQQFTCHGLLARISTMVYLPGYPPWFTCQDIHHVLPARISTMVYLPGYPPWFTYQDIHSWFTCQDIHPWSLCVNGQQSPELEEKNKAYIKYRICTFSLGNKFYFFTNKSLVTDILLIDKQFFRLKIPVPLYSVYNYILCHLQPMFS